MADYKIAGEGVMRRRDGAFIPPSDDNMDWQAYQKWVSDGNEADPEFTPEEITENTKHEARQQILADLRGADRLLLKMITALYQVLRTKGTVAAADFDADLIADVQAFRQKVQDYEDLG
jgi:hypothetical protein